MNRCKTRPHCTNTQNTDKWNFLSSWLASWRSASQQGIRIFH